MTGSRRSITIMRPNHCWTILHMSILAGLLLTLNADSEDSDCELEIRVRRNTVYEVSVGDDLIMNCTVQFCSSSTPTVFWHKIINSTTVPVDVISSHVKTDWKSSNHHEGISHLVFHNILRNDSGFYLCKSGTQVSHYIKVSVNDCDENYTVTQQTVTNSVPSNDGPEEKLWTYMYATAGILTFVIIVIIISVASMYGCKGNSKKDTETENQYVAIPMVEQPFPDDRVQAPTRGSPSAPPPRRSTRRKSPSSQPRELPSPRDNQPVYGEISKDRGQQRNSVVEEGSSLVYAALNHQPLAGGAARPRKQMEETSEYAAIRVKDATPTTH